MSALLALCLLVGAFSANTAFARQILVYVGKSSADKTETYSLFSQAAGVTAVRAGDDGTSLPGNLAPYSCVMLHVNMDNFLPSEIQAMQNYLAAGGRLVAVAEYGGVSPYGNGAPISVMNDVAAGVGATMSLSNTMFEPMATTTSSVFADTDAAKLTQDVSSIYYGGTSQLSASGTARVLMQTQLGGIPFVGAQKIGNGQFVLVGDSNVVANDVPNTNVGFTTPNANGQFARNLCGDTTKPVVVIHVPVDRKHYKLGANVLASYACTDPEGTNDIASCVGPANVGQPIDTTGTAGKTIKKTFTVVGTDDSGNTATATHTYYVDDDPPDITINNPANVTYTQGTAVNADFTCTDADPLDPDLDGEVVELTAKLEDDRVVASGFPVDTQATGQHTLNVTCRDDAGNVSTKSVTYTVVDSTDPTITITRPQNQGHYKLSQQVASSYGCVDEDGPADIPAGQPVGPVANGTNFDTSTTGSKSFTVTCTDKSGNTAQLTHTYYVDGQPPVITIAAPVNGGVYDLNAAVPANYSCTDDDVVASLVGTVPVDTNFDTSSFGRKPFKVTCTDLAGNVATASVTYLVGNHPPTVDIQSPKDGATFALNSTIALNFSCSDPEGPDDLAKCARVGATGPLDSGKAGVFEVTVEAIDLEGNRATKTHKYTVTAKPTASAAPTTTAGATTKACKSRRQFTIRVKKTKKKQKLRIVRVAVSVNGKQTQVKKGKRLTAVVTLKGLPKGRYRVVIKAKLSNGKTITDVRRFRTCTPKGKT